MNWVGGIRDKVHKNSETLAKQREHFQKQRFAKQKQRLHRHAKKGVSRDILNLDCITKTIRNPFDDEVVESDVNSAAAKIAKKNERSCTSSQSSFENSGFQHQFSRSTRPSTETAAKGARSSALYGRQNSKKVFGNRSKHASLFYQSTPLPPKDLPWSYPQQKNSVSTGISCDYSTAPTQKFNLPSPIPSQENFQPSSRLPITLLSDENLESQSMLCESKRCYREAATLTLKNNDVTRYSELLHGVASTSHHSINLEERSPLSCADHYENYDVINHRLLSTSSAVEYNQSFSHGMPRKLITKHDDSRVLYNLSNNDSHQSFSAPHSQVVCDYPQIKREDENVFPYANILSNSYPHEATSYDGSSSSPTCFSLFTSSKSSRIQNTPVSTPEKDLMYELKKQQDSGNQPIYLDKGIQVTRIMVDASTSPVEWKKYDFAVQVPSDET